ncbi:uncharacterized protein L969DRAFT_100867 [Mixia osmundae IAM 14324]|uniref:LYR motif-containing protein Cup1-like N-terminal domain-containing protein n=1 Tax=Mixia osmundae (strain CBS 9802 / IAM 14324 / JCM 22182 / KY 12970) TaxID=764103 RepID=G7E870_MIXOS|nr:uncharacterized protein L969DRAFT_100867 [Mixia osmundae IAM 14324]KEI42378.1 hypothetical protein L969DRAFT_100867 [Mixia osmundae IAM 14324]GAA99030.1 hypothetical protein E5Q_05719 [Mixia osmundae IAM 14324]
MHAASLRGLYRHIWREIRAFPDAHSVAFWKDRLRSTYRAATYAEAKERLPRKARDILNSFQWANDGHVHAYQRILRTAYGRRGPLRHLLLQPYVLPSRRDKLERLIPGNPRSALPSYSPELRRLMKSNLTIDKQVSNAHFAMPPTMPATVDPNSPEAQIVGPLSLRRQANIHWRFWANKVGRLNPPLPMGASAVTSLIEMTRSGSRSVPRHSARGRKRDAIPSAAANAIAGRSLTRPTRKLPPYRTHSGKLKGPHDITPRYVRRRAIELLAEIPLIDSAGQITRVVDRRLPWHISELTPNDLKWSPSKPIRSVPAKAVRTDDHDACRDNT